MYFRQKWTDKRLEYPSKVPGFSIKLGDDVHAKIWRPDTFFASSLNEQFHSVTTANNFIRVEPSGSIFTSSRITVDVVCESKLFTYPFNRKFCHFAAESYGFGTDDLSYQWDIEKKSAFQYDEKSFLKDFTVIKTDTENKMVRLTHNDYSRIELHFTMDRNISGIVVRYFIPMILLVLASFTSLYLTSSPFIVQAVITTLCLVFGILYSAVINFAFLPSTGNFTFFDLFNLICILYITTSFVLVLYRMEKIQRLADMTTTSVNKMDENLEVPEAPTLDSEKKLQIMILILSCSFLLLLIIYCILVMSLK